MEWSDGVIKRQIVIRESDEKKGCMEGEQSCLVARQLSSSSLKFSLIVFFP